MSDARSVLEEMQISQAEHLPLVAAFLERMGLAAVVNAAVPSEMAVDLGSVVKLMILDTLSGRSPLYRLERFAGSVDTELLLGKEVSAGAFNDTTLGRALDASLRVRRRAALLAGRAGCGRGLSRRGRHASPALRHYLGERLGGVRRPRARRR